MKFQQISSRFLARTMIVPVCTALLSTMQAAGQFPRTPPNTVVVDFTKTLMVSKSTPTLQVVVNPMIAKGSPIHDGTFGALKDLGADYVRYVRGILTRNSRWLNWTLRPATRPRGISL